jgi:hypothetical protein
LLPNGAGFDLVDSEIAARWPVADALANFDRSTPLDKNSPLCQGKKVNGLDIRQSPLLLTCNALDLRGDRGQGLSCDTLGFGLSFQWGSAILGEKRPLAVSTACMGVKPLSCP